MRLRSLKWLTAALVIGFLFGFDYLRHFILVELLHHPPLYIASIVTVCLLILSFNHHIFTWLESMQRNLRQQNQRLATLNALGATLSRSLDLDDLLDAALAQILETTGVAAAALSLSTPERLLMRTRGTTPVPDALQFTALRATIAHCAASSSAAAPSAAPVLAPYNLHLWIVTPLRAKGAAVGCLLLMTHTPQAAGPADRQLLDAIGAQIGIAIENATLHQQIARQASQLSALIESSANAIITIGRDGTVRSWNRAAEQIYGWPRQEAIGQPIPMVPEQLKPEAQALIRRILDSGVPVTNLETQRLRHDGELIPVLVTASPVRSADGTIDAIVGISTDLRERKRLERDLLRQQRDLAAMAERERLARALHDDVGQILGYVNMQGQAIGELLAGGQTGLAGRQLDRMVTMVQEAHAEVRQHILDLKVGLAPGQSLRAALEALVRHYQRHQDFAVELRIDGSADLRITPAGQTQLLHIVQEALVNARRHAYAQLVQIHCVCQDDHLLIMVADNGRGFAQPADLAQSGNHFGLRIMQDRAAEIGGHIDIHSQIGSGTTIRVTVPVCQVEEVCYESIAG